MTLFQTLLVALAIAVPQQAQATTTPEIPQTIEGKIISITNDPVMVKIATCESGLKQFETDGSVRTGKVNPLDKGLFQINEKYHLDNAKKMGLDIYTVEGNIHYAEYLHQKNGYSDWKASKPCWLIKDV